MQIVRYLHRLLPCNVDFDTFLCDWSDHSCLGTLSLISPRHLHGLSETEDLHWPEEPDFGDERGGETCKNDSPNLRNVAYHHSSRRCGGHLECRSMWRTVQQTLGGSLSKSVPFESCSMSTPSIIIVAAFCKVNITAGSIHGNMGQDAPTRMHTTATMTIIDAQFYTHLFDTSDSQQIQLFAIALCAC